MKNKALKAVAALMAVVCLSGCSSNKYTSDNFINIAKKYGMEECTDYHKFGIVWAGPQNDASVYYTSKDAEQADIMCYGLLGFGPEACVEESVVCAETSTPTNDNPVGSMSHVFLFKAKDEEAAQKIYDYQVNTLSNAEEGVKNGTKYAISFWTIKSQVAKPLDFSGVGMQSGSVDFSVDNMTQDMFTEVETGFASGIYLKGDTVIWVYSMYDVSKNDECVKTFCNKLGLKSPYSLK
ncbi:MAG: hypothetical protein K5875_10895 [Saccharofermentans sp.]|nr:hypothetical protein [Saccharofermentans sp.]